MAVLNEEQTMLRDMAHNWAQNESPVKAWRKVRDANTPEGYDPATYQAMAEMGWAGIIIPEEFGGSDFGYLSLGLVLEEAGRTLVASPLNSSAMAATSAILLGGNDAQKGEWLPKLAAGEVVATLAVDEGPVHNPAKINATATKSGNGWTLSGTKAYVVEANSANLMIVAAQVDGATKLFLVPADVAGISMSKRVIADMRNYAEVTFDNVSLDDGALLGEGGDDLLDAVLDRARAGVSAEMLGMSVQAFNDTLEYLKTRRQFGQLLSSFQALQHRMANLFTEIELMRSSVEAALEAIDAGRSDVAQLVSLAKATASDTMHLMSRELIQLHGGIGVTDEHDAGFYLKRARVLEHAWGNASFHVNRFAKLNGY